jgi:rhodanese-related sulfurtransferase
MQNISKIALIIGISFLATFPALCEDASKTVQPQKEIQDTNKAAKFFEDELNFKTNSHGVKMAVEGKVKNVTIVDVRAAKDFAKGHIPGAINVPYNKYNNFEGPETDFPELRKDGFNYVYCYDFFCNLSLKAGKKFASLGYPVKEMVGGFSEWKKHKYPVEK